MSQRTGIPANLIAKAMKMARDGVSHAHIAAWARCPVATIDSLVKKDLAKPAAKAPVEQVAVLVPKEVKEAELVEPETTDEPSDVPDEVEPTEENTKPD